MLNRRAVDRAVSARQDDGIHNLARTLARQQVVVCCGAGGVGKTTVSAALAMAMVAEQDRRVLVLTIDPAKRLATALGIERMGLDAVEVPRAHLRKASGREPRGTMHAAMLDMKTMWDRMVERYAPNRETAQRILQNRFYQGISDAFVGSHEYMAMEALYELHSSHEYDCVIIDTPPSRNALDFLEAPNRLADFVGARMLSWLAGPAGFGFRAMNFAARPFLGIADRLIGGEMLRELGVFVRDVQAMYGGVQDRARQVYRLLRSPQTGFVVVTTLEPTPFAEAEFFVRKLKDYSMPLRGVVVNRVLPPQLCDESVLPAAHLLAEDGEMTAWLSKQLGEKVSTDTTRCVGATYTVLHGLADRDARQLRRLGRLGHAPVARVPLSVDDVSDVEALGAIAAALRGQPVQFSTGH